MKSEDINVLGIECDVASEVSVQKAFKDVMNTFGRVDAAVASAGMLSWNSCVEFLTDACQGIVENYTAFE